MQNDKDFIPLSPDLTEEGTAQAHQNFLEQQQKEQQFFDEHQEEVSKTWGLGALGAGRVSAFTDPNSYTYIATVGAAKGIEWLLKGSISAASMAANLLDSHGMGERNESEQIEKSAQQADLGLAHTTSQWLDYAHQRSSDTSTISSGLLSKALYYAGWGVGEFKNWNILGKTLKAEEISKAATEHYFPQLTYAESKVANLFGRVVSKPVAEDAASAVVKGIPRAVTYGSMSAAGQLISDKISERQDLPVPDVAIELGKQMGMVLGFEAGPPLGAIALPAVIRGGKKLWDASWLKLLKGNEHEAQMWGDFFDTSIRTDVDNAAPVLKSAIAENINALTPETRAKLKWYHADGLREINESTQRQDQIIEKLGTLSDKEIHQMPTADLFEISSIFKMLKDNSPDKYERWNKFDLHNRIDSALPDHGVYGLQRKVMHEGFNSLTDQEKQIYTVQAENLTSPVKEADYIKDRYLKNRNLNENRLNKLTDREAGLRERANKDTHEGSDLIRELHQTEEEIRKTSNRTSALDSVLNGDWTADRGELENAISSSFFDENKPDTLPSYKEQIAAVTEREPREEANLPTDDEGGAKDEAEATQFSNLSDDQKAEFDARMNEAKQQEKSHPSYKKALDDSVGCILSSLKGAR